MPRLSTDRLGGEYVDTTWVGRVGPDERVTRTATHRFDSPGSYVVTWNGVQYDVRVAPARGTASVADVTVSDTGTDDGRAVLVLDATVRNDGRRATFAAFPVTRDGQRVSTAAVVVGGTDTRTVTVRVDAPDSNPTTIGVGAVTTSVPPSGTTSPTVTSRTPASSLDGDGERQERDVTREPTGPDPPAGSPGIDRPVIAALVALLAAVGIWRWRSRRH
jgi:MYXO-CTERM domain-containing protein